MLTANGNQLRRIRLARTIALGVVTLVAGCSLADFAYDLAPRIALRYVDDYLQLSNRQEAQALELFRARHALHARDELPRYHRFLLETRAAVQDGITAQEIDILFDGVNSLAELGIQRTIPAAATVLAGLDDDQLDALDERLQESAAEYRERLDDDHRGRRLGETLEDIEEWLGEIEDAQRAMLTRELRAMTETGPLWLEWRMRMNERLMTLLRARPAQAEIETFLAGYWLRSDKLPPGLVDGTAANRERYRDMIVALDASLSAAQRAHALERIDEFTLMVVDMMPEEVRVAALAAAAGQERSP